MGTTIVYLALPTTSVVTVFEPRKLAPSPFPDGSQLGLTKRSIWNVFDATLVSVPLTYVLTPSFVTFVITGAACAFFPPATRTIPRAPLWSIESRRILFPFDGPLVPSTLTPAEVLNAIVFCFAADRPPTVLPLEPANDTPSVPLGSDPVPKTSVPR